MGIDDLLDRRWKTPAHEIASRETPQSDSGAMLAHRWTLEELWSFILKLDRLEQLLAQPEGANPVEALPEETAPNEAAFVEVTPEETAFVEAAPCEDAPAEAAANESAPAAEAGSIEEVSFDEAHNEAVINGADKGADVQKPHEKKTSRIAVFVIIIGVLALLALGIYRLVI